MKKQCLSYDYAEDGLEALNKFRKNPDKYFLILMDMVGRNSQHTVLFSRVPY